MPCNLYLFSVGLGRGEAGRGRRGAAGRRGRVVGMYMVCRGFGIARRGRRPKNEKRKKKKSEIRNQILFEEEKKQKRTTNIYNF